MKQEEQIRVLAKLDGFKYGPVKGVLAFDAAWYGGVPDVWHRNGKEEEPPNYLTSYDAIVPLIRKLWNDLYHSMHFAEDFVKELYTLGRHPDCPDLDLTEAYDKHHQSVWMAMFLSTPAQLSEAVLRATKKWKE